MEEARSEAQAEVRREWERRLTDWMRRNGSRGARLARSLRRERERYFAEAESEVVRLALAIAGGCCSVRSRLMGMLLAAMVRVALEKVAGRERAGVACACEDAEMWRAMFCEEAGRLRCRLWGMRDWCAGECVLETNVGQVELGVEAQMEEMERGFLSI